MNCPLRTSNFSLFVWLCFQPCQLGPVHRTDSRGDLCQCPPPPLPRIRPIPGNLPVTPHSERPAHPRRPVGRSLSLSPLPGGEHQRAEVLQIHQGALARIVSLCAGVCYRLLTSPRCNVAFSRHKINIGVSVKLSAIILTRFLTVGVGVVEATRGMRRRKLRCHGSAANSLSGEDGQCGWE